MKKYNLSKIMKRAWELVRKAKINFTEALRFSWTVAKKEVALKNKYNMINEVVTWNIWCGYGRVRAYYKCDWYSNYQNNRVRSNFVEM